MKSKEIAKFDGRILRMAIATAAALGGLACMNSYAGQQTANLSVTATVSANCTISTTAVAFNEYDPIVANASSALDATGAVKVTCTVGSTPKIMLGQGAHAASGSTDAVPLRRMNAGSSYLSYSLFSDAGRSTVWGNTDGTHVSPPPATGTIQTVDVYGRVAAGQNVPVGSYSDTVVATVTF
jgi:spore coat protein U-like protein